MENTVIVFILGSTDGFRAVNIGMSKELSLTCTGLEHGHCIVLVCRIVLPQGLNLNPLLSRKMFLHSTVSVTGMSLDREGNTAMIQPPDLHVKLTNSSP